jgi:hypothetical protein
VAHLDGSRSPRRRPGRAKGRTSLRRSSSAEMVEGSAPEGPRSTLSFVLDSTRRVSTFVVGQRHPKSNEEVPSPEQATASPAGLVLGGDQHPEAVGIEVIHRAQVDNHSLEAGLQQLIDQQVELLGAGEIDRSGEDDPRQVLLNLGLDREASLGILCQVGS